MVQYAKYISETEIQLPPTNCNGISNYCYCEEVLTADGYLPLVVDEEPTDEKPCIRYKIENDEIHQYTIADPDICKCFESGLTTYAVNAGLTSGDKEAYATYNQGVITFLAGTIYTRSKLTTRMLKDTTLVVSSLTDGEYNIFVGVDGELIAYANTVSSQINVPENPATNDYFLNIQEPTQAYLYNGSAWVESELVHIGKATVSGGVVSALELESFNRSFDAVGVTGDQDVAGHKNFTDTLTLKGKNVATVSAKGNNYIEFSNGLIIQWARATINSPVTLPTPFSNANYYVHVGDTSANKTWAIPESTTSFIWGGDYTLPRACVWVAIGN